MSTTVQRTPSITLVATALAVTLAAPRAWSQPMPPSHTMDALDRMQGPLGLSWMREGSGTAWQPDATPMFGHMQRAGGWAFMEHYNLFVGVDAAAGPRGGTEVFSTNWVMAMARHTLGGGLFSARVMLSLEPWTLPDGGYPLLLQTGETHGGRPLHDRQHPHDLFMEAAVEYQRELFGGVAMQVYVAPSGEPALGPVAFPHRLSAWYDPLGPITHHWLDASHITFGVVTAGIYTRHVKVEGSWFNGREPDETRYDFDLRVPDSWSARITANPFSWLSAQVSYGYLHSPEALHPDEPEHRVTASATTVFRSSAWTWATTAAWGLRGGPNREASNAVLVESSLDVLGHFLLYGRAEYAAKRADDLAVPSAQRDALFHVGDVSLGVAYAFGPLGGLVPTVGVRGSVSLVGGDLRPEYGDTGQLGGVAYVQLRPAEMRPMTMGGMTMPGMAMTNAGAMR